MFKTLAAATAITGDDYAFMKYVSEYGKSYGTVAEFNFRKEIFLAAEHEINAHNNGDNTHTLAHNEFSDMTKDEFSKRLGYKHSEGTNFEELDESNLEASVDWRSKGAVTPVKNQGQCGSCWAFSTTGAVEGAYAIKHGSLKSFSEQQLVDCSKNGNNGCSGGLMDYAFKYIESNPLELESAYTYTARNGTCKYQSSKGVATVRTYKDVSRTASQLKASIAQGPTSVAIEADQRVFQSYKSGVITSGCGTSLDHGVLAVGYGTESGNEYALVKNSWGPSWGDHGYVKIGISNNQCGVLNSASRPSE